MVNIFSSIHKVTVSRQSVVLLQFNKSWFQPCLNQVLNYLRMFVREMLLCHLITLSSIVPNSFDDLDKSTAQRLQNTRHMITLSSIVPNPFDDLDKSTARLCKTPDTCTRAECLHCIIIYISEVGQIAGWTPLINIPLPVVVIDGHLANYSECVCKCPKGVYYLT